MVSSSHKNFRTLSLLISRRENHSEREMHWINLVSQIFRLLLLHFLCQPWAPGNQDANGNYLIIAFKGFGRWVCACVSVGGCVRVTVQEGDRKSERERERERKANWAPSFRETHLRWWFTATVFRGPANRCRDFVRTANPANVKSAPRENPSSGRDSRGSGRRNTCRLELERDRDKKSVRFTFRDRFSSSAGATKIFSGNGRPETSARSLPGAAAAAHSGRQR